MGVPEVAGVGMRVTTRATRFRTRTGACVGAAVLAGVLALTSHAGVAGAQATHVFVVQGLSGDPKFRKQFDDATAEVVGAARKKWSVQNENVVVFAEEADAARGIQRASREGIAEGFTALSRRVKPGDMVLVLLMGHGSGEGPASKVNIPGPDATAADFATWLSGFSKQTVVFVNAATGSGDFVPVLAAPGRIVVTATKSAMERNESVFATHFAKALAGDESDSDKDGRVSVMEAFRYATGETARAYTSTSRLQTEHAQVSDSVLARRVAFGGATSNDPRVGALIAERQELEASVAALRGKKASMETDAYERELERLLIAIAEKTKAIRAVGGTP